MNFELSWSNIYTDMADMRWSWSNIYTDIAYMRWLMHLNWSLQVTFLRDNYVEMDQICILYGFPCEMDFSHHESPNPVRIPPESRSDEGGIRRRVVRNPSHMENHTKCIFSHTLHFKAL